MVRERQAGPAAKQLSALRARSGLSQREIAARLEIPPTTYVSWEMEFKKPFFAFDRMEAVAKVLVGLGDPPITKEEVMALAGVGRGTAVTLKGHFTTDALPAPRAIPADATMVPQLPAVPEIDVKGGAGMGGEAIVENFSPDDRNQVSADLVLDYWGLPDAYLQRELRVRRQSVRIIEIRGDSMEPTFKSRDRVMIDVSDRTPSPDGPFAIFDGMGVIVKRLERVPNTEPITFKIISDNPKHNTYERTLDEISIIGRVVWYARSV